MATPGELWRRLRHLWRRSRFHAQLDDEMRFHVECRVAEFAGQGVPGDEALARARREFGSARAAAEETREAWQFRWLEDLAGDLRYAARALRRNPRLSLTAVF